MTSMFRTTALAATLAAASFGLIAGPLTVKLDLFELGEDAKKADNGKGAPVAVGEIQGFVFSDNAFAYHPSMLYVPPSGSTDLGDLTPPDKTSGAFIMNGDRSTLSFGGLEISLGKGYRSEGRYFQYLDTSLFASAPFSVKLYSGSKLVPPSYDPTFPNLTWQPWEPGTAWSETDRIDRVVISAGSGGYVGLQEISLTLSSATTGGGGNVPEPGSYALVGLALLAAGAASRRRA